MEVACNSNCPRGFKTEDAITSNNGLALLASLTLKNVLKINNNCSIDNSSSNSNNKNVINNRNKKQNNNVICIQINNQQQKQFNNVNNTSTILNHNNSNNHYNNQVQKYLGAEVRTGGEYYPLPIPTATTMITATTNNKQSSQEQQQQKLINGLQQTLDINSLAQQHQQQQQKSPVTPIARNRRLQQCDGYLSTTTLKAISSPSNVNINVILPSTTSTTLEAQTTSTSAPTFLWEALKACKINAYHSHNNKNNKCNNNNNINNNNNSSNNNNGNNNNNSNNNNNDDDNNNNNSNDDDNNNNNNDNNNSNNNHNNNNVSDNKSSNVTTTTAIATPTTVQSSTTTTPVSASKYFQIPPDILDDLASRFIINVPEIEQQTVIRVCFQIELAHWFYLDFFCMNDDRKLQSCGIKHFAMQLFEHIPFLRQHLPSVDTILDEWKYYKLSVPTYGAILISEDLNYCLLVQSYFAKSSWGFPKGKVNENEDPMHCAQREVYEETGFDITKLLIPNDFIESVHNYQVTRLYIVQNVPLETKFIPRTRNEIKSCDWFPIDALPVNKNDAISKAKLGINANSFFMIIPFIKRLKKWIHDKRNEPGVVVSLPLLVGGSGSDVAIASDTAVTSDDNIFINNSPLSSKLPLSPLNTTFNNRQQQEQQQKCNTTGKKPKQQRNSNNNNYNSDDTNHKSAKQNSNNDSNSASTANVQRTISYTLTNLQQQQQQKHQVKQQQSDVIIGDTCNNEVEETPGTIITTETASPTNYSKRQRHKSMGDLDGIKVNNNFHNNNSTNAHKSNSNNKHSINNNNNNRSITKALNTQKILVSAPIATVASTTTISSSVTSVVSQEHQSTQKKRHSLKSHLTLDRVTTSISSTSIVYDPSLTTVQLQQNNSNNNKDDSKRHLIINQNQQHQKAGVNDQKAISSFELIRREKQQMNVVATTAQKQQNQQNHDGRMRTKSQGDKLGNNIGNSTNKNNNYKNVINKTRSSKQNNNNSKNDNHKVNTLNGNNNNINNKSRSNTSNNNIKMNQMRINGVTATATVAATTRNIELIRDEALKISKTSTSTQFSGQDLLAFHTATASVTKEHSCQQFQKTPITSDIKNNSLMKCKLSGIISTRTASTTDIPKFQHHHQQQHQPQFPHSKMAIVNGTNIRILQRSTSHQPTTESTTQKQHQQQQQRPVLEFQPSFNSWTNFTFTKNFIANVFC